MAITNRNDPVTNDYPAPRSTTASGRALTIAGAVCAVVAIFFLPIILGPIGAVLAFVGYSRGYKAGLWVGIGAIVATLGGMALGAWVFTATHHTQTTH